MSCRKAGVAPSWNVGGGEIDRVVAFAHIEGAAIDGDSFNDGRDEEVGIGIAIAVSIGGKVVRVEKVADLEELRDGLAVIAGYARREVLRSFDSAGGGFNRQAGERDGRSRTSGIGIQHLVVDDDALRGIGVSTEGAEATTVIDCWTDTSCWNCKSIRFCADPTEIFVITVTKDGASAVSS